MSFMKPEIVFGAYYDVETSAGIETVPADLLGTSPSIADLQTYCVGAIRIDPDIPKTEQIPERKTGWLARLSAPDYMDCTDWTVHKTETAAREYLDEAYGSGEE